MVNILKPPLNRGLFCFVTAGLQSLRGGGIIN